MNVARSGASASLIEDWKKKIYVFGGCWDDVTADSSNWVEVYDIETETWGLLSVSTTPKMYLFSKLRANLKPNPSVRTSNNCNSGTQSDEMIQNNQVKII